MYQNFSFLFLCPPRRVTFKTETIIERQEKLKYFSCQCKACQCNYPLESDVRAKNIPHLRLVKPISKDTLASCAVYLEKYSKFYPCKELLFVETEFRVQLELLYNAQSMENRYK